MKITGEHEKLQIYTYKNEEDLKTDSFEKDKIFTLQINPEEFAKKGSIKYYANENIGNYSKAMQFGGTEPQTISLEFLLDGTGAFSMDPTKPLSSLDYFQKGKNPDFVNNEIGKLEQVIYEYNGQEHRTPFVGINWRNEIFKGVLISKNYTYSLFEKDGKPLQASVKLVIKEFVSTKNQADENKESSPDLTHVRTIKQGDNIMLLTKEIYGNSKYYWEIARVNKLINFRKLNSGSKLVFPPLEKKNS